VARSARPMSTRVRAAALLCCGVIGCAVEHGSGEVRSTVKERIGHEVGGAQDAENRAAARKLLARPLDAERAVGVAMLQSSRLAALLAELGIARAQVLAASRIENPELDATARSVQRDSQLDLDFMATENLTSLILLPTERAAANAQFAAERLRATRLALDLAFEVRRAFFDYQASVQASELARKGMQAADASSAFAVGLREAGNISQLDLDIQRVLSEELRIAVAEADALSHARRERLNALMGVDAHAEPWTLAGPLPEPPPAPEAQPAALEGRALANNLELREWSRRAQAAGHAHDAAKARGLLPQLRAGASVEREDHAWGVGPSVGLRLPLFDQGQAGMARAEALQARALATRRALEHEVRAAARAASKQLQTAREAAQRYRDVLLPLRASILEQTQLHYNGMQLGVFQLVDAKRQALASEQQYVLALRDYWLRRTAVEQLLAGSMPQERVSASPSGQGSGGPPQAAGGE
jgi:outer membrane protein, heavy metal efflux system